MYFLDISNKTSGNKIKLDVKSICEYMGLNYPYVDELSVSNGNNESIKIGELDGDDE